MHLDRFGDLTHPEHHIGQDQYRYHRDNALEQFLLLLREFAGGFIDEDAERQAQSGGNNHPYPYHA
ncbi:hypothetical protein D3C76_1657810 [compost metagenome]